MNESKQRHGCVNIWLWMAIISNVGLVIYYTASMFEALSEIESLGFGLLSVFAVLNVLGVILLLRWNKTGFYLFVVSSILTGLINVGILNMDAYMSISNVFAILMWWVMLQIRKNGVSAWKLLEGGWDYKHCRHLYQVFVGIIGILLVVTAIVYTGNHEDYSGEKNEMGYIDVEEIDTTSVEVWKIFKDNDGMCSIEAPDDFYNAEIDNSQILGLMRSDYDPAILIVTETANSLKNVGINTAAEYAKELFRRNRNDEGVSGFNKISEKEMDGGSYLIVYNLSIDDTQFRYYLLSSRTKQNFYYCKVFCLEDYAENLYPTISHMINTFKTIK